MAAIFQIRRGSGSINTSISDGELYLHKSSGSLQVSVGDGNPVTLARLDQPNSGSLRLGGDITASNAYFSGDVAISGNLFLGNNSSDNISALGVFTSNLSAGTTNTYDIGSTTSVWRNVYATSISGAIAATNGVISGSSQLISILDPLNAFSSSQLTQNTALATISGSLILTASANTISITNLNAFSGSQLTQNTALATITGSLILTASANTISIAELNLFSGSQLTQNTALATITGSLILTASANTISIAELNGYSSSLKDAITVSGSGGSSTTTIKGNLVVQGTQTTIDSTTIQLGDNIIELNGTGIANGGLVVKDPTGASIISGSLLWDSTLDYWKGGTLGNESKILLAGGDSVVSSSAQITPLLPTGVVSGSQQVTSSLDLRYLMIDGDSVVSSSAQILNYNVFATTGSNSFNGGQSINGNLYLTGSLIPSGNFVYDLGSATNGFGDVYLSSSTVYMNNNPIFGTTDVVPVQVGDYLQGGIVYYVDTVNGFSYIVNKDDIGEVDSSNFTRVAGANSSVLGGGIANTNAITASTGGQQNPAKLCSDFSGSGYTDWYLPSTRELAVMASNTNLMGASLAGVRYFRYWSSTADSNASKTYYAGDDKTDDQLYTGYSYGNSIMYSVPDNRTSVGYVKAVRRTNITEIIRTLSFPNFNFSGSINVAGTIDGIAIGAFVTQSNERITELESSSVNLNLYTSSANAWSGTIDERFTTLGNYTASVNQTTASLNQFSASINFFSSSTFTEFSNSYDAVSESFDYRISILDPGNLDDVLLGLNAFTSSTNGRLNNIEAATSSYETKGRGIVSGSQQVIDLLPTGVISSSFQIVPLLPTGVVSGSSQIVPLLPTGVVSGSIQVLGGSTVHSGSSGDYQFNSIGVGTAASTVAGEIRATADITAFYSSDIRLKENIHPILHALEKVKSISGNTYNWKAGFDEIHSHKGNDIGVIAQEIEAVLPQIVTNRDNGYKAVQYEKIIPLLVEAIKELSAKIDRLENK